METKRCTKCKAAKTLDKFPLKSRASGKRASWCKSCHSEYTKGHYRRNTEAYKRHAAKSRARTRSRAIGYIGEYLSTHPCVDCGEDDILVLQFDHVSGEKEYNVTDLLSYSVSTIKSEVKKCDVRCANCHIRRHMKQSGAWRNKWQTRQV